jgi:hypothetical protein
MFEVATRVKIFVVPEALIFVVRTFCVEIAFEE